MQERTWLVATRVTAGIVATLFVALLVTGVVLIFRYEPSVNSFASVRSLEDRPILTARSVHRVAALLFVPAVAALAVASGGLFLVRRNRRPLALSMGAVVVAVAAAFTGYLLPWDQLSLWAVTVGTNMRGYTPILDGHSVKYVLVGSSEIGPGTIDRWFWVHTVAIPVVFGGALLVLVLLARRTRRPATP
jgi:quinol-cytochrome oxidoreductase complex cytochrome b subunit